MQSVKKEILPQCRSSIQFSFNLWVCSTIELDLFAVCDVEDIDTIPTFL